MEIKIIQYKENHGKCLKTNKKNERRKIQPVGWMGQEVAKQSVYSTSCLISGDNGREWQVSSHVVITGKDAGSRA